LTLSNTSSFLPWSVQMISPSFSNTTFQNFPGVSDVLPEASKFQYCIKLCSKCSIFLSQFQDYFASKKSHLLVKYGFAISILDLISQIHLASFHIL
jgi:hypothetical protein